MGGPQIEVNFDQSSIFDLPRVSSGRELSLSGLTTFTRAFIPLLYFLAILIVSASYHVDN